jgi:hypothetical protein
MYIATFLMAATRQHRKTDKAMSADSYGIATVDVVVFRVHTDRLCGLRDHPISFLPTSTCNKRKKQWNATEAAGTTIRSMPGVFQRTRNSWHNRAQLFIGFNDGPFQLLWQTVSKCPDVFLLAANRAFLHN